MAERDDSEIVFQNIALVRTLATGAQVQVLAIVRAISVYDAGPLGRRWAALLVDASGDVPIFGFEAPPPLGATLALRATVSGWAPHAKQDAELVREMTRDRGFFDEVELLVDEWQDWSRTPQAP